MAESSIAVTTGSGKNIRTNDRTISSVLTQEQIVHLAEPYLPTYTVATAAVSTATTDSHLLQIMAGANNHLRINRVRIYQGAAGSAAVMGVFMYRLSTAGTTGTSYTPRPLDSGDAAAGATALALPSSKGTEGVQLFAGTMGLSATAGAGAPFEWDAHPRSKGMVIPAGTANGFAIKIGSGVATATVYITVEFTETAWL